MTPLLWIIVGFGVLLELVGLGLVGRENLWPGGFTHGGARRNGNAQILNVDGVPIRGLYGAGEFGSVNGMVDASSGSLVGECIAFGRLAGEHAASLRR